MSGMGSVCKSMPEQSLIHEQEVQANMRSLQQPRGQPSQPGKYAFGLKCYRRRPQPRPLFLVRDGVFTQPLFDKIKNTPNDMHHLLRSIFKSLIYNCCYKVNFEIFSCYTKTYFKMANRSTFHLRLKKLINSEIAHFLEVSIENYLSRLTHLYNHSFKTL